MAIKTDIRDLPSQTRTNSWPGPFRVALSEYLQEERTKEWDGAGERPQASEASRVRHSWAGKCSRRLYYDINGTEASNVIESDSLWSFAMGDRAHDLLQAAVARYFEAMGATVTHEFVVDGGVRTGHADTLIEFAGPTELSWGTATYDVRRVIVEYKSTGGFNFGMLVKKEGPKTEAYLQSCLNAELAGADLLVIIYVSLDRQNKMANQVYGKARLDLDAVLAEWVYTPEEFVPDALAEAARLEALLAAEAAPRATLPGFGADTYISDPMHEQSKGMWVKVNEAGGVVESGTAWQCGFCPFRDRCANEMAADGPGVAA